MKPMEFTEVVTRRFVTSPMYQSQLTPWKGSQTLHAQDRAPVFRRDGSLSLLLT